MPRVMKIVPHRLSAHVVPCRDLSCGFAFYAINHASTLKSYCRSQQGQTQWGMPINLAQFGLTGQLRRLHIHHVVALKSPDMFSRFVREATFIQRELPC